MNLSDRQQLFAYDLGKLLVWINEDQANRPWRVTMGDVMARTGHKPNSNHYIQLAADLNLFVEGVYIKKAHPAWYIIGEYWKSLSDGNRWGGDFKGENAGDFNHVSAEWQGRA